MAGEPAAGGGDSDEEQVEREWHLWLAALAVVGGIALYVAPASLVPGLVRGLGPLLVVVGVVGWLIKETYQRWG